MVIRCPDHLNCFGFFYRRGAAVLLNCSLTLVSQISIIICISSPHFLKSLFCSANKTVQGKSSCTGGWKTAGGRSNVFFKNHKWDPAFCHSSCSTLVWVKSRAQGIRFVSVGDGSYLKICGLETMPNIIFCSCSASEIFILNLSCTIKSSFYILRNIIKPHDCLNIIK